MNRLKTPSPSEFEEYRASIDEPAVLEGMMARWPAYRDWSVDYFSERWGACRVDACTEERGEHRFNQSRPVSMPLSQVFDRLTRRDGSERELFFAQLPLTGEFAAIAEDVAVPDCVSPGDVQLVSLWTAAEGTSTHLHWDSHPGLLALVRGRKSVGLFSPDLIDCMYPVAETERRSNWSRVDFLRPDPTEFPRYQEAPSMEVELVAGEVLYIPQYWWHHVRNRDLSIAVQILLSGRPNSSSWASFYHRRQAIRSGRIQLESTPESQVCSPAVRC